MFKKFMIGIAVAAALIAFAPLEASARMGGGGGGGFGGGGHGGGFGGGGGFHGGGGGFHGGGGFSGGGFRGGHVAAMSGGGFRGGMVHPGGFSGARFAAMPRNVGMSHAAVMPRFSGSHARVAGVTAANFRHNHFGHGHFRRFAPFAVGIGIGLPYYDSYAYPYYDSCYDYGEVPTPYGYGCADVW